MSSPTKTTMDVKKEEFVIRQIKQRGVADERVLTAMRKVPREEFVPLELREFAYGDHALPIEEDQTISQPYIVALMTAALQPDESDRVLEVGTGSGYAAAILAEVAAEVYTIERHGPLAEKARQTLRNLGYKNVEVRHGDGTQGWPDRAPFDGIVVAAGGPDIPSPLKHQLKIGGRLVIPIGTSRYQELLRVTRLSEDEFDREQLGEVRFVPLIGAEAWPEESKPASPSSVDSGKPEEIIKQHAYPLGTRDQYDLGSLPADLAKADVVLLGEATHGTAEFYEARAAISKKLIQEHDFTIVAVEADWPDARRIDTYVRHLDVEPPDWKAFSRFPTWMWRNQEVADFIEWLREYNRPRDFRQRVGFYGLDLYSLYRSIGEVLQYLQQVDPEAAETAKLRYGCLTAWEADPTIYGRAAATGRYRTCESETVSMLSDLLEKRLEYAARDGDDFNDAVQNARLIKNAEKYYRVMYYGGVESWNLRDQHMFTTLERILEFRGGQKAILWEHNSHIGDARATEMASRGEHNVGQLCREQLDRKTALVGFGTHRGKVAAASEWDGLMEIKEIRPSLPESYEGLFHQTAMDRFHLHLTSSTDIRSALRPPRLERAIGVIYRPETERLSHYFQADLSRQFDYYLWFEETSAVTPLDTAQLQGVPETYPFGI